MQGVLPPYRTVSAPGQGMLPRTPQKCMVNWFCMAFMGVSLFFRMRSISYGLPLGLIAARVPSRGQFISIFPATEMLASGKPKESNEKYPQIFWGRESQPLLVSNPKPKYNSNDFSRSIDYGHKPSGKLASRLRLSSMGRSLAWGNSRLSGFSWFLLDCWAKIQY